MLHPAANSHVDLACFILQPTATPRHTSMASYGHSCSQQAPQGHTSMASYGHPSLPFASSLAANRHPRATHQWLLMGVQVCRLPALKPSKPLKPSKRLKPSKPLKTVKQHSSIAACPLPAHSPLLLWHSSLPFATFKRLKPLKPLKPSTGGVEPRHLPPPLQSSNCCMASSQQLPPSPLAVSHCCSRVAACPLPAPSAFQHCSLPFACT